MLKVDKGDISFFVNCRYVGYWFGKIGCLFNLFFRLVSYF